MRRRGSRNSLLFGHTLVLTSQFYLSGLALNFQCRLDDPGQGLTRSPQSIESKKKLFAIWVRPRLGFLEALLVVLGQTRSHRFKLVNKLPRPYSRVWD